MNDAIDRINEKARRPPGSFIDDAPLTDGELRQAINHAHAAVAALERVQHFTRGRTGWGATACAVGAARDLEALRRLQAP